MTLEEFASLPPWASTGTVYGPTSVGRDLLNNGIRRARNELLVSGDAHLRQCYDYLQDAREAESSCLFHIYKLVETLENALGGGGEKKLIKALNMRNEVRFIKKLANDPTNDVRHPPNVHGPVQHPSMGAQTTAMNYAHQILRAYERYVRRYQP